MVTSNANNPFLNASFGSTFGAYLINSMHMNPISKVDIKIPASKVEFPLVETYINWWSKSVSIRF